MPPTLSVVDYDAWNKGYMPPSNHILIHKLSYEDAKVVISTSVSREHQMWIVIEGPPLTKAARKMLREVIKIWFDDEPEQIEAKPSEDDKTQSE